MFDTLHTLTIYLVELTPIGEDDRSSEHSPETPAFATVHAVSSSFG
ncbi:hypothetical protein HanRHA438_Chr17g0817151 [Helianthus annuus]|nr:hypothetical protein HanRHA438_Chr17g0817151 [Helianthus annuus]